MGIPYRIVFSDVDGTLLNRNRDLSSVTIHQIKKLVERRILFAMVSARMPAGMLHLYRQIPLDAPAICYNGALVLKSIEKGVEPSNVLHSSSIDYNTAISIYFICKEYNLHFSLYTENQWFASKDDEWRLREENNTRVKATIHPHLEAKILELERHHQHIHKIMVMGDAMLIEGLVQKLQNSYSKTLNIYRSKDTYLELSPATANKAMGCKILLNHLSLTAEQAIAFGDNYNDIEMLEMVTLGVAMDNAPLEVKNRAKRVAPANTDDGVAKTLELILE